MFAAKIARGAFLLALAAAIASQSAVTDRAGPEFSRSRGVRQQ